MFVNENARRQSRKMPVSTCKLPRNSSVFPMDSHLPLCYNGPEEREGNHP